MTVKEARAAALAAKALVMAGRDPHREKLALRATETAQRGVLPQTSNDALDLYVQALSANRERSAAATRQAKHYTAKAIRLMRAERLPLTAIDATQIRVMLATMDGSGAERAHVYGAFRRFTGWCRRKGLLESDPCADIGADEKPRRGRSRDNTPSIDLLRRVWAAVEGEQQCDLVRFLLIVPLRRGEASGLTWREVDLDLGRIRIAAERMKKGAAHELPLPEAVLAILRGRKSNGAELVFPSAGGKPYDGWTHLVQRIRKRIGQVGVGKAEAFTFHDVRRSFVSTLAERGFDVDLLDQCLAHTRKGVMGVYQRASRMNDRAAALRTWASLLLDDAAEPNNVVSFARRADV